MVGASPPSSMTNTLDITYCLLLITHYPLLIAYIISLIIKFVYYSGTYLF